MLTSVNLALSNLCYGHCIFCPVTRGKSKTLQVMPVEYARKIIAEVASGAFGVHTFQIGENGDALLNPAFIEIVRYLKERNPAVGVNLFTNFQHLTRDKSEVIVREGLIDWLCVNIDGHDAESYFKVKGIPYRTVEQNVLDFLGVRAKHGAETRLNLQALTFTDYVKRVVAKFGKLPANVTPNLDLQNLTDDFPLIEERWRRVLNPRLDTITRSPVFAWAERDLVRQREDTDLSGYECPNILRVSGECFIAPNGDWYACCYDDQQQLVWGNVVETSIRDVYQSEARKRFIRLLKNRRYDEIGYPCNLVEACQWI